MKIAILYRDVVRRSLSMAGAILSEERAAEISNLMQGAALDPARWESTLNALSSFVDASGVALLSVEARQRITPASTDMVEMIDDYFGSGWFRNDLREACVPLLRQNGIVFDYEAQSISDLERSDYYQDFLLLHRRKWFAGVGASIDGDVWCLSFQRSPQLGPFRRDELQRLRCVRRMLAGAAHLSSRIGQSWARGLEHALALMRQPAALLDSKGRVLSVNDAALPILTSSIERDRHIRFGNTQATDAFHRMLIEALAPPRSDERLSSVLDLGGRSFAVRVTGLLNEEMLLGTSAALLVEFKPVFKDHLAVMKESYGLTETEAKVSFALANGKSVKEVAADNRVKDDTVRSQLKSVYNKLNVNKQSQLVAFVKNLETVRES